MIRRLVVLAFVIVLVATGILAYFAWPYLPFNGEKKTLQFSGVVEIHSIVDHVAEQAGSVLRTHRDKIRS